MSRHDPIGAVTEPLAATSEPVDAAATLILLHGLAHRWAPARPPPGADWGTLASLPDRRLPAALTGALRATVGAWPRQLADALDPGCLDGLDGRGCRRALTTIDRALRRLDLGASTCSATCTWPPPTRWRAASSTPRWASAAAWP